MYYRTGYDSPVGPLMLASDGTSLTGLWMEGQKYFGGAIREELVQRDDLPVFAMTRTWLERYFARERPDPSELPLAPPGGTLRPAAPRGAAVPDSIWRADDLWSPGERDGGSPGQSLHVGPGSGRRGGA